MHQTSKRESVTFVVDVDVDSINVFLLCPPLCGYKFLFCLAIASNSSCRQAELRESKHMWGRLVRKSDNVLEYVMDNLFNSRNVSSWLTNKSA